MSPAAKMPGRVVCIMLSTLMLGPSSSSPQSLIGPRELWKPMFTRTSFTSSVSSALVRLSQMVAGSVGVGAGSFVKDQVTQLLAGADGRVVLERLLHQVVG